MGLKTSWDKPDGFYPAFDAIHGLDKQPVAGIAPIFALALQKIVYNDGNVVYHVLIIAMRRIGHAFADAEEIGNYQVMEDPAGFATATLV